MQEITVVVIPTTTRQAFHRTIHCHAVQEWLRRYPGKGDPFTLSLDAGVTEFTEIYPHGHVVPCSKCWGNGSTQGGSPLMDAFWSEVDAAKNAWPSTARTAQLVREHYHATIQWLWERGVGMVTDPSPVMGMGKAS